MIDNADCLINDDVRRLINFELSNQFHIMLELLNEGAITIDDLEDFSEDLKETMKHFFNR